jgi:hypothetical protein
MTEEGHLEVSNDSKPFDFVGQTRRGKVLLVGEGDLSFALALASRPNSNAKNILATTFEKANSLSDMTIRNGRALVGRGGSISHGIDATKLHANIELRGFQLIAFQFPNTATRESVHQRTANHYLVRRFLKSAVGLIARQGKISISLVDSAHHNGAFDIERAGFANGFQSVNVFPFFRSAWIGYRHVNTNNPKKSALRRYRNARTWVFENADREA